MLKVITSRWVLGITLGILLLATFETAYSKDVMVKIPSSRIKRSTKVLGMRTFAGKLIAVKMIRGLRNKVKVKVLDIMKKPQIELKNGEIIYPEEIHFFYTKKKSYKKSYKKLKQPITYRAPEGDD